MAPSASQANHVSLSSLFGLVALFLACVGLYGVIASLAVRRTHEIGIGVVVGIVAAVAVTRLMATLLFGVRLTDAVTLLSASLSLIVVAAFACYIPARRATKVDPMVAPRFE